MCQPQPLILLVPVRLPRGRGYVFGLADVSDAPLIAQKTWSAHSAGYIVSGRSEYLHRLLMGAKPGQDVDHINGNKMDNRRANLRLASRRQNAANSPARKGKFKGVHRHTQNGNWIAQMRYGGKTHHLGVFETELEAALAYDRKALEVHGQFARLNVPQEVVASV